MFRVFLKHSDDPYFNLWCRVLSWWDHQTLFERRCFRTNHWKCWLQACRRWQSCHFLVTWMYFHFMPFIGHKGRNCWPKGLVMRWAFLGKIFGNRRLSYCSNFFSLNTIVFPVCALVFTKFIPCHVPPIYCFTEFRVHVRNGGPFQYFRLYGGMFIYNINQQAAVNHDKSSISSKISPTWRGTLLISLINSLSSITSIINFTRFFEWCILFCRPTDDIMKITQWTFTV